ncbi:MAG: hypothetical protein JWP44_2497, partial [Mucilaginibacter sp.]|nr:hypothetical protein [Mucilaginibacter sp.]
LSSIWNHAESKAKHMDEWVDLMTWTIFANLHSKAERDFQDGKKKISTNQIDKEEVKNRLIENLQKEGYEDMLREFKLDNPTY